MNLCSLGKIIFFFTLIPVPTNFIVEAIPKSHMVPRGDNGQFLCEIQASSVDAPKRGEIKIQADKIIVIDQ